jgi:hypothetical protein
MGTKVEADILGRSVKTQLSTSTEIDLEFIRYHQEAWDGSDDAGEVFGIGVDVELSGVGKTWK